MIAKTLKTAVLAAAASAALLVPAAQAGHRHHHHGYQHHFRVFHGHHHYHRPVWVRPVYTVRTCYTYKQVWVHGYKRWVCVKPW